MAMGRAERRARVAFTGEAGEADPLAADRASDARRGKRSRLLHRDRGRTGGVCIHSGADVHSRACPEHTCMSRTRNASRDRLCSSFFLQPWPSAALRLGSWWRIPSRRQRKIVGVDRRHTLGVRNSIDLLYCCMNLRDPQIEDIDLLWRKGSERAESAFLLSHSPKAPAQSSPSLTPILSPQLLRLALGLIRLALGLIRLCCSFVCGCCLLERGAPPCALLQLLLNPLQPSVLPLLLLSRCC